MIYFYFYFYFYHDRAHENGREVTLNEWLKPAADERFAPPL